MKARAAVILIQNDKIALIERHRQGLHYFVFPGGKIEANETPAAAAGREAEEELGLKVKLVSLVAEVWYLGSPQYYFLVEAIGGQFGHGFGSEMNSTLESIKGTYHPLWLDVAALESYPLRPKLLSGFIQQATREGRPENPLVVTDAPPDEMTKI